MTKTVLAAALLVTPAALAQDTKPAAPAAAAHVVVTAPELKWGPAPPALPPGSQMVVLTGDPRATGPFTLRAKLPAGYKIGANWHPTDEHATVLEGTFSIGMGDAFDMKTLSALPAGGFTRMPAEIPPSEPPE